MSRPAVVVLLGLALAGCGRAPALTDVVVEPAAITPDQDGEADVARLAYTIGAASNLSITLVGLDGASHVVRDARRRGPGRYEALFGGIVDGRMVGDGEYAVRFSAEPIDGGPTVSVTRSLTVAGGDTVPPALAGLTVHPSEFSPNQDGIADRVAISYRLDEPADVRLWLEAADGTYVTDILEERTSAESPGEPGPHVYDFDAGVDADAPPPPDGTYRIVGEARDRAGNVARAEVPLTIRNGGQPRAALVGDVTWSDTVVALGDTLFFTATVANVGATPIRTRGPAPGFVYDNTDTFNQVAPEAFLILAHHDGLSASRYVAADRPVIEDADLELIDPVVAESTSLPMESSPPPADGTPVDAPGAAEPFTVCGVARTDGAPTAGVEVHAFESDGDNGVAATTDEDGRYCFRDLTVPPAAQRTYARSPGAVRLGAEYDDKGGDIEYPFRWQLGRAWQLDACEGEDGAYLCLPPGRSVTIGGGIRFTEPPFRRSTTVYLAVMHEDVRRMHGPYQLQRITVEY